VRHLLATLAVLLLSLPAGAADMGSDAQREEGKQLYDKYCSQCHALTGDGQGYATPRLKPEPRDFTSGKYKFRTTPSGMLPTDADLIRVIKEGLPYTSMPGWPMFSDAQIQNIVYHLKTFSDDFRNPEVEAAPIEIGEPTPSTEESVTRGKQVYKELGCAACHGNLGRGDGPSAPTLKDDWGAHIRPADMSQPWTFRGGPTRVDMFRTFSTGLNGTPMPSYFDALPAEDRWHLVNYMVELSDGDEPDYANLVKAAYVEDDLELDEAGTIFETAEKARFPLIGQIIEPGRNFYPSATAVEVKAVYNRREIALLVRWNDMRAETSGVNGPALEVPAWDVDNPRAAAADDSGDEEDDFWGEEEEDDGDFWGEEEEGDDFWGEGEDDGGGEPVHEFSDAVALQFPSQLPAGNRKPYFIFGDVQSSVDLWFVNLARGAVEQYIGRGSDSLEVSEADEIETLAHYDQGTWSVMFKRDLRGKGGVTFTEDQFVPLSFSVWDGFNRERGNKRALSPWFYLYTEPIVRVSPVGPMIKAGLLTLFVELIVVFLIRRRFANATASAPASGRLPQGAS